MSETMCTLPVVNSGENNEEGFRISIDPLAVRGYLSERGINDDDIAATRVTVDPEHLEYLRPGVFVLGRHYPRTAEVVLYSSAIYYQGPIKPRKRHDGLPSNSQLWPSLSLEDKCNRILLHELEHRIDQINGVNFNLEAQEVLRKARLKRLALNVGTVGIVGACAAGMFAAGYNNPLLAGGLTSGVGIASELVRRQSITRVDRNSYLRKPYEERAHAASLNTNVRLLEIISL